MSINQHIEYAKIQRPGNGDTCERLIAAAIASYLKDHYFIGQKFSRAGPATRNEIESDFRVIAGKIIREYGALDRFSILCWLLGHKRNAKLSGDAGYRCLRCGNCHRQRIDGAPVLITRLREFFIEW